MLKIILLLPFFSSLCFAQDFYYRWAYSQGDFELALCKSCNNQNIEEIETWIRRSPETLLSEGDNCIRMAILKRNPNMLQFLIEKGVPLPADSIAILFIRWEETDFQFLALLLQLGADPTANGVLGRAAQIGNLKLVQYLVEELKVNIDDPAQRDQFTHAKWGYRITPLIEAILCGEKCEEVALYLLHQGAEFRIGVETFKGGSLSILELAEKFSLNRLVEALLKKGAKRTAELQEHELEQLLLQDFLKQLDSVQLSTNHDTLEAVHNEFEKKKEILLTKALAAGTYLDSLFASDNLKKAFLEHGLAKEKALRSTANNQLQTIARMSHGSLLIENITKESPL